MRHFTSNANHTQHIYRPYKLISQVLVKNYWDPGYKKSKINFEAILFSYTNFKPRKLDALSERLAISSIQMDDECGLMSLISA
jgi:hypothetical protein